MATSSKRLTAILTSPFLVLMLRLVAGSIFIFSAVTKLPLHSQFVAVVQSYHLLAEPLAIAYALTLPWAELLIGAYLLLGILLKPSAVVTILIGISFMVANVSAIIRGEQYCPSCFGEAVPLLVSQALAIDIFLMIAALLLLLTTGKEQLLSFDSWFKNRERGSRSKLNSTERTRNYE